ncbi:hypothetical protein EI94DRAFT_1752770 [Lactarius quietus]|nr:hypothetical protein EI94DRAFT_1752770 [Lactarius quietus]
MAHYDIFRDQLAISFPGHGHALWEPSPGDLTLRIFHRLFNILLPADDPSHENFGVPDNHEQFQPKVPRHIISGILRPDNFCSAAVNLESDGLGQFAIRPSDPGEVVFSCKEKPGANTVWMIKHIDQWFSWSQGKGLGISQMEDIVLLTGTDLTRSWANVAFLGQANARVSFGVEATHSKINWQFSPERKTGSAGGIGGQNLPEDQCIFIRGFRVRKRIIWWSKLRAAAGPNPDPKDDGNGPAAGLIALTAIPKAYRNRTLQPDVVLSCLRSSKLAIHEFELGPGKSSSSNKGANADTEIVRVASFSAAFKVVALVLLDIPSQPSSPYYYSFRLTTSSHARGHVASYICLRDVRRISLSRPAGALPRKRRPASWHFLSKAPSSSAEREEAWASLDFRKSVQVTVPFESTGIYDFTGGALLLGTRLHNTSRRPTIGYSCVTLPSLSSTEDQKLKWRELSLGIQILDVGLAVHEHDLIAALTACKPIIFVALISLILGNCNVLIEIVGEFVALLITFPLVRDASVDMFFLVRWKTGKAHRLPSERGAYAYFSFLTEDTLVIPNLLQNTLEITRIVVDERDDDVPRLVRLCTLGLPPLAAHASIIQLSCHAEPNPTGSGSGPLLVPARSSRPFYNNAADAIMLFNLLIDDTNPHAFFHETRNFTFIVHRHALVAQIPHAEPACAPFRSAPGTAPTLVPWFAWGVPVTRWFESDPASMPWVTTSAGQRAVTMEDNKPTPIIVRDFNPYAVRAALARQAARGLSQEFDHDARQLPNGNRQVVKVEENVIPAGTTFREDVQSALPYIETITQNGYYYEGALIDEERILGLEVRLLPGVNGYLHLANMESKTKRDPAPDIRYPKSDSNFKLCNSSLGPSSWDLRHTDTFKLCSSLSTASTLPKISNIFSN